MKKAKYLTLLFILPMLASCGEDRTNKIEINKLGDINAAKDTLVQGESLKLTIEAPSDIDIKWSVSNSLATIDASGTLNALDKDGSFIVTASYGENDEFKASKAFTIYTPNIKDLTKMMFNAGSLYNYTVDWKGTLYNQNNEEVDLAYIKEHEAKDSDAEALFNDLVTKGNIYKAEMEAYYCLYGVDGYGNEHEGGSYNSPDGYVYDYSMTNGKFTKGSVDYYSGFGGISDYKKIYTGDLSKFVKDEFKIEDSNLTLSEDKTSFLYDSKNDKNQINPTSQYESDYSIAQTVFNCVDPTYASSFQSNNLFSNLTGKISYTKDEIYMEFYFKNLALSEANNPYSYTAKFKIFDIGKTTINGLKEQIELDKKALEK